MLSKYVNAIMKANYSNNTWRFSNIINKASIIYGDFQTICLFAQTNFCSISLIHIPGWNKYDFLYLMCRY